MRSGLNNKQNKCVFGLRLKHHAKQEARVPTEDDDDVDDDNELTWRGIKS